MSLKWLVFLMASAIYVFYVLPNAATLETVTRTFLAIKKLKEINAQKYFHERIIRTTS